MGFAPLCMLALDAPLGWLMTGLPPLTWQSKRGTEAQHIPRRRDNAGLLGIRKGRRTTLVNCSQHSLLAFEAHVPGPKKLLWSYQEFSETVR